MSRLRAEIYLDYAATSPMLSQAQETMRAVEAEAFGNPSSEHWAGAAARDVLEGARAALLARAGIGERLVFTSGATESNLLGLLGTALAAGHERLIVSAIEHPSVSAATRLGGRFGMRTEVVGVDSDGRIRLDELARVLRGRPASVALMHASNEVGTLQPIAAAAELVHRAGGTLHVDAVQSFCKVGLDELAEADTVALAAHKIGGPRGIGALLVGDVRLESPLGGGTQEGGLRHGTENVAAAAGFASAAVDGDPAVVAPALTERADHLRDEIAREVPDIRWTGDPERRAPHIVSAIVPGVAGEVLVASLDAIGIAASVGSACRARNVDAEGSGVLAAMGATRSESLCAVRFSVGMGTTPGEVERAGALIGEVVHRLREMVLSGWQADAAAGMTREKEVAA